MTSHMNGKTHAAGARINDRTALHLERQADSLRALSKRMRSAKFVARANDLELVAETLCVVAQDLTVDIHKVFAANYEARLAQKRRGLTSRQN